MTKEKDLEGIGGWLVLVAIGITLSPIRMLVEYVSTYFDIISIETWRALTTPGSESYNILLAAIVITEILLNGALILAWVYIGYRFFSKSRKFPKLYIMIAIFSLLYIIADTFAVKIALPNEPLFDPSTVAELMPAIMMVAIWVPYMLISKRVKATFIK